MEKRCAGNMSTVKTSVCAENMSVRRDVNAKRTMGRKGMYR